MGLWHLEKENLIVGIQLIRFQLDPTKMFLQVAYPPLALYFYKTQFSFYLTLDLIQFPSGHLAIVP